MNIGKKLRGRALSKFEAKRNVWQEVLDGVREIKSGGDKRSIDKTSRHGKRDRGFTNRLKPSKI